jgi:predicted nucleotidyltransferase component of viral defense system
MFDRLVDEALKNVHELSPLRMVVEKELLHHDILRTLSKEGLLSGLTFMGGTCLRLCYGSNRLSEDLDFTGGKDFTKELLSNMSQVLIDSLKAKYELLIQISEPKRESGNVDTWVLKIQTRPERREMPTQRINIDICAIPSYQPKPMLLLNPYGVDMGTGGLILQVESREEILADKIIAFALRKNRIKNRDLWDIAWLYQNNIKLSFDLVQQKIEDHKHSNKIFVNLLNKRKDELLESSSSCKQDFIKEMQRFLPADVVNSTINQDNYWSFLVNLMSNFSEKISEKLSK